MEGGYLNPRLLILQRNQLSPSPALDDGTSSIYPDPHDDPLEKVFFYDTVSSTRKPVPVEPDHVQRYYSTLGRQGTPWRAPPPKDPQYTVNRYNPHRPLPSLPPLPPPRPSVWARFNFLPVGIRYSVIVAVIAVVFVGIILITLAGLGRFSPGRSDDATTTTTTNGGNSTVRGGEGWNMSGEGQATFYYPDVGVGSCGFSNKSTDLVAALNYVDYGTYANPNHAPSCDQCILVTGPKGSVEVTIVDKCPNCTRGDLDLSPTAFQRIAVLDQGRVSISWRKC